MLKNEEKAERSGFKGYLKGIYKEDGDSPFTSSHMAKARDKGVQIIPGKISFRHKRKNFHNESNQQLDQSPQRSGRFHNTEQLKFLWKKCWTIFFRSHFC